MTVADTVVACLCGVVAVLGPVAAHVPVTHGAVKIRSIRRRDGSRVPTPAAT